MTNILFLAWKHDIYCRYTRTRGYIICQMSQYDRMLCYRCRPSKSQIALVNWCRVWSLIHTSQLSPSAEAEHTASEKISEHSLLRMKPGLASLPLMWIHTCTNISRVFPIELMPCLLQVSQNYLKSTTCHSWKTYSELELPWPPLNQRPKLSGWEKGFTRLRHESELLDWKDCGETNLLF